MRQFRFAAWIGLLVCAVTNAAIVTTPPGLQPGDQYRLVFVTADGYAAYDSNLADYNSEVNTEADSVAALDALGTTWLDIGSTSSENAIANIGQDPGIPIYNLDGQLVADDGTGKPGGLFLGSLINPVMFEENGEFSSAVVWTGTQPDGAYEPGYCLGCFSDEVVFGYSYAASSNWVDDSMALIVNYDTGQNILYSLYAISGVITVPTPEPATVTLIPAVVPFMLAVTSYRRLRKLIDTSLISTGC